MPSGRRKYEPGEKEAMLERAIELRKQGVTYEAIAQAVGIGMGTAQRWTKGYTPPKSKTLTTGTARNLDRQQKRQVEADRERNRYDLSADDSDGSLRPPQRVLAMPTDPSEFDVRGPDPDPYLVEHAKAVLSTWVNDKALGRLITVTGIEKSKAIVVLASAYRTYDWEHFANNRTQWCPVRELAGVNMEELAERVGLSFASISRYEKAKRNPDPSVARQLHVAYTELQETAINRAEWILTLFSYADAELDGDHDATIDRDDLLWWITGDQDDTDALDISHVTHLATVRALLPYPTWRESVPSNLWLSGYPKATLPA